MDARLYPSDLNTFLTGAADQILWPLLTLMQDVPAENLKKRSSRRAASAGLSLVSAFALIRQDPVRTVACMLVLLSHEAEPSRTTPERRAQVQIVRFGCVTRAAG